MASDKKPIWLAYNTVKTFSGQMAATTLIFDELGSKFNLKSIPFPSIDRAIRNPFVKYGEIIGTFLKAWGKIISLVFKRKPVIYFNHTQSLASFIRMGIPHLLIRTFNRSAKIVTSLNGSTFTNWEKGEFREKLFSRLLRNSDMVTVVGNKHKRKLVEFGIKKEKIKVVYNPCEFSIMDDRLCEKKNDVGENAPLNLLHLSLLIESKGYPEYLEALEMLSKKELPRPIKAIICGPMHFTNVCKRFMTPESKSEWINKRLSNINESNHVSAEWIPGARGKEKEELFKNSHIFVFPSQFPNEAQPLVLCEAMASGNAIVTSDIGEIESTISKECATVLHETSVTNIANAIEELLADDTKRVSMAIKGLERAEDRFSINQYARTWDSIFKELEEA